MTILTIQIGVGSRRWPIARPIVFFFGEKLQADGTLRASSAFHRAWPILWGCLASGGCLPVMDCKRSSRIVILKFWKKLEMIFLRAFDTNFRGREKSRSLALPRAPSETKLGFFDDLEFRFSEIKNMYILKTEKVRKLQWTLTFLLCVLWC